jgi:hypothetical protein
MGVKLGLSHCWKKKALRLLENMVLRIFGPKREKVTAG